jgi:hypothetical protein
MRRSAKDNLPTASKKNRLVCIFFAVFAYTNWFTHLLQAGLASGFKGLASFSFADIM